MVVGWNLRQPDMSLLIHELPHLIPQGGEKDIIPILLLCRIKVWKTLLYNSLATEPWTSKIFNLVKLTYYHLFDQNRIELYITCSCIWLAIIDNRLYLAIDMNSWISLLMISASKGER